MRFFVLRIYKNSAFFVEIRAFFVRLKIAENGSIFAYSKAVYAIWAEG